MASSIVKSIDKVVLNARTKYNDIMSSEHVAKDIRIDGYETRGQVEENTRKTTTKEEYTRTVTCMLDAEVKRGSLIEIRDTGEIEYKYQGVVTSVPNRTPVDFYFQCLLFNTVAHRYRHQYLYSDDGYVLENSPLIIDDIPCFVQRIGQRERQINVGIDRDSVNEFTTTKNWDIQKGDILHIGSDRYKITDLQELDEELLCGYMTYYRE